MLMQQSLLIHNRGNRVGFKIEGALEICGVSALAPPTMKCHQPARAGRLQVHDPQHMLRRVPLLPGQCPDRELRTTGVFSSSLIRHLGRPGFVDHARHRTARRSRGAEEVRRLPDVRVRALRARAVRAALLRTSGRPCCSHVWQTPHLRAIRRSASTSRPPCRPRRPAPSRRRRHH